MQNHDSARSSGGRKAGFRGAVPPRLPLDRVRDRIRVNHCTLCNEHAYCDRIERFIDFRGKRRRSSRRGVAWRGGSRSAPDCAFGPAVGPIGRRGVRPEGWPGASRASRAMAWTGRRSRLANPVKDRTFGGNRLVADLRHDVGPDRWRLALPHTGPGTCRRSCMRSPPAASRSPLIAAP